MRKKSVSCVVCKQGPRRLRKRHGFDVGDSWINRRQGQSRKRRHRRSGQPTLKSYKNRPRAGRSRWVASRGVRLTSTPFTLWLTRRLPFGRNLRDRYCSPGRTVLLLCLESAVKRFLSSWRSRLAALGRVRMRGGCLRCFCWRRWAMRSNALSRLACCDRSSVAVTMRPVG
jgi:hypothetical protein